MPDYKVTDKQSGKTYRMPWNGSTPPSRTDISKFIWDQENPSIWTRLNRPLTDLPSRIGTKIDEALLPDLDDTPTIARVKGFFGGSARGAGDLASSFSSPLSLGATVATGGAAGAARAGLMGASRGLTGAARAIGGGTAAHGGYRMGVGVSEGDLSEVGAGSLEAVGGLLGAATPYRSPQIAARTPRASRPRPTRRGIGEGRVIEGQPPPPIDADFRVVGDSTIGPGHPPGGLPPLTDRGLPPARPTYYGGRHGIGTDIDAVETPPRIFEGGPGLTPPGRTSRNWADATARLRDAGETRVVEPPPVYDPPRINRDILEQNSPYGRIFAGEKLDDITPDAPPLRAAEPPKVAAPKPIPKMEDTPGPYAKTRDQDVGFFAEQGDEAAIAEARKRPALWQSLKTWARDNPKVRHLFEDEGGMVGKRDAGTPRPDAVRNVADDADDYKPGKALQDIQEQRTKGDRRQQQTPISFADRRISERRQAELMQKWGGTKKEPEPRDEIVKSLNERFAKLLKDEGGFIRIGGGPKKKSQRSQDFREPFEGWVNERRATKVESILKQREFKDLDSLGMDGIFDFQEGVRSGRLADVARYFDRKFAQLSSGGVRLGYRENYLPQLWENGPDEVFEVYRRLGLKPSFSLERVLENYRAGIDEGLKPRYKTVSELVGWYEGRANKALADRKFFDYLVDKKWIAPKGQAPSHWVTLDPDHFPVQKFKSKGKEYQGALAAPPEIADKINNYLRIPKSELTSGKPGAMLQGLGDLWSVSKNFAMSAGIPKTAANAHGLNMLARTVIFDPKSAFRAAKYVFDPRKMWGGKSAAEADLEKTLHTAPWAVKKGLTLTTEHHEIGVKGSSHLLNWTPVKKFLEKQGEYFEDPLFQNMIPALKLKHFNDMVDDLVRSGMDKDIAGKHAAEFTNNIYGGINWEAMGRSRDLGNVARLVVLAPDWLATNYRLGKGFAKTLLDPSNPVGKYYARAARNLIGAYLAADVINYTVSGHHMWENEPTHTMDMQLGKSGNKVRWFRPFGTAADFVRLPLDIMAAALRHNERGNWEPDLGAGARVLKNRLAIPTSTIINLLTNQNDFGRPIAGRDDYGRPIPPAAQVGGYLGEISDVFSPPYVRSAIEFGTGRIGGEEAVMGAVESPVRYSTPKDQRRGRGRRTRSDRR
jgi:hypothetical protein